MVFWPARSSASVWRVARTASTDALPPRGFSTRVPPPSRRAFAAAAGDRVRGRVVAAFGGDVLLAAFGRAGVRVETEGSMLAVMLGRQGVLSR